MNYYNSGNLNAMNNPIIQQIFGGAPSNFGRRQIPQITEDQFFSFISTLNESSLKELINRAKRQGISEEDIKAGVDIILKHR